MPCYATDTHHAVLCRCSAQSTQIVAEYPDEAFQYDIILRSDLDAFMCPRWGPWVPERRDTMYVGKGGFIQGNEKHGLQTLKRLHHAAQRLGLPVPTVTNPGTSWVGDGRLLITAARLYIAFETLPCHRYAWQATTLPVTSAVVYL